MRILLDTNILVDLTFKFESSGFSEPDLFEQAVGDRTFLVSVVSIWEVAIKTRLNKLAIGIEVDQLGAMVTAAGGTLLAMSEQHVLADIGIEPDTKDPFDRLLLSTAAAEDAVLVTRDYKLQSHPLAWRAFPQ